MQFAPTWWIYLHFRNRYELIIPRSFITIIVIDYYWVRGFILHFHYNHSTPFAILLKNKKVVAVGLLFEVDCICARL